MQFDPYMAAQKSKYNINNPVGPAAKPAANAGEKAGGQKVGGSVPRTSFRTLSDLGSE